MKTLLLFLLLLIALNVGATNYTEFYCDPAGTNINSGSTTNATATYTATNGNWTSATGVFVPTSGNPSATVNVGDFASVFIDDATVGVFVSRVTAVTTTNITTSLTAISGTAPTTSNSFRSIKVGGAWSGPNGAVGFPANFVLNSLTNASGHPVRVNLRAGTNYAVTAAMTHSRAGPIRWQGYTTTPGDLGKATIDGGTNTAGYVLLTVSGVGNDFVDLIFTHNGTNGLSSGLALTGSRNMFLRVVANNFRGDGFDNQGLNDLIECEAYACNLSNTSGRGGFDSSGAGNTFIRCISHDNLGSATDGFVLNQAATMIGCIADSNGRNGAGGNVAGHATFIGCEFYNNAAAGIDLTGSTASTSLIAENCNFIKNGTFGITSSGSALRNGQIVNCGFGSGTHTNASGGLASNLGGINVSGTITYSANLTPWLDPANGDFSINLAAAKNSGRGNFTATAAGYGGTVGYPDVGAAPHTNTPTSTAFSFPISN